jgi:hypothetical protein
MYLDLDRAKFVVPRWPPFVALETVDAPVDDPGSRCEKRLDIIESRDTCRGDIRGSYSSIACLRSVQMSLWTACIFTNLVTFPLSAAVSPSRPTKMTKVGALRCLMPL